MSTEMWLALIAIAANPLSGWFGSLLERKKSKAEIDKLRVEIKKTLSDVRGNELNNVREGNEILMSQIVAPLKQELKSLRYDVNKFRRAIEKIPACPHSDFCPVALELRSDEKDDNQPKTNGDKDRTDNPNRHR